MRRGNTLRSLLAIVALIALALAGCGSEPPPPSSVPEPAAAPPVGEQPAGQLVRLGGKPEGVVADPETGLVAVALRDPPRLALVDGESGEVEREVRLPAAARHLQLAAPGGPVLVPAEKANRLVRVALPSGEIEASTEVGRFPHDATATAGRFWAADEFGDSVSVVEGDRVVKTLPAPKQPGGIAATAGRVGVVAVRARKLEAYDQRTLESIGEIGAGVGPTHGVAHPDGRFFVTDTQGDAVLFYRLAPELEFFDRLNVPGTPFGIALDVDRGELWVTQTALNRVTVYSFDGRTPRRLRSYPTPRQANTVSVDAKTGRAFVAARDGRLQIIEQR